MSSNSVKDLYGRILPSSKKQINDKTKLLEKAVNDSIKIVEKKLEDTTKNLEEKLDQLEHHIEESNEQISNIEFALNEINLLVENARRDSRENGQGVKDYIEKALAELNSTVETLKDNLWNDISDLKKMTADDLEVIKNKQTEISNQLKKPRYTYNNDYERAVIASFYKAYEQEDYKERFLKLVSGLEDQDVEIIVRILQRQILVKNTMHKSIDIFTEEEQNQIIKIDRELKQGIFKVSDDMYCFKHYLLPIRHFEASVFIYKHGIDCIENLEAISNKDVLDVGGFIGDSILILKPLTNQRVISFEATSENFCLMKQTVKMNHLDNVILEKLALGKEKGKMTISLAGSSSSFQINSACTVNGTEEVAVDTLDAYMEGKDIDVGLIKVDIEGAEQAFMEGAKKTIKKFKPVLLMSIYHNADDFFNIKPIIEGWNLGYKFKIHKPVDYSISREVLLVAEVR